MNHTNKKDVIISKVWNYGRNFRKEFLISKKYLIKLNNFNKVDLIVNSLDFKDIKSIQSFFVTHYLIDAQIYVV